jgi:hypothetical protein
MELYQTATLWLMVLLIDPNLNRVCIFNRQLMGWLWTLGNVGRIDEQIE